MAKNCRKNFKTHLNVHVYLVRFSLEFEAIVAHLFPSETEKLGIKEDNNFLEN